MYANPRDVALCDWRANHRILCGLPHHDTDGVNELPRELFVDRLNRSHNLLRSIARHLQGRSHRKMEFRLHIVGGLLVIGQDETHRVELQQQQGKHHHGDCAGECDADMPHRPGDGGAHGLIAEHLQPRGHSRLDGMQWPQAPSVGMSEMGRKDEDRFNQGHGQDKEHHQGKDPENLERGGGHEVEGNEGQDSRCRGDGDRAHHGLGAGDDRLKRPLAQLTFCGDAFPHHQGVVHHQADHEEHGQQGAQVHG